MRAIAVILSLLLLASCAHKAPLPSPILRDTPPPVVLVPPPHPAPRPPAIAESPPTPAPLPAARPEQPGDRTPDRVCADLARHRAEDAATLGGDARKQQAVHDDVYAHCMSGPDQDSSRK